MRLILILIGALALTACSSLRTLWTAAFDPPVISFDGFEIREASFESLTLELRWRVENKSDVPLQIDAIDYQLEVEGKPVAAGDLPRGLALPASSATLVRVPATVRFKDVAPVLEVFLKQDQASYVASGHLGIDTPIGRINLPLERRSSFDVPKLPKIELAMPVPHLSLGGPSIELPLSITNRNSFALPIDSLSGSFSLGGAKIAAFDTGPIGPLEAKQTMSIKVPIKLGLSEGAAALAQLKSGQALEIALDGELRSRGASLPLHLSQTLGGGR